MTGPELSRGNNRSGYPAMQWTPVWGNCNEPFPMAADEFVRCTGIEHHQGLHRCHYQPTPDRTSLLVWGDDEQDVSIGRLCDVPNPLGLIPTGQQATPLPTPRAPDCEQRCDYGAALDVPQSCDPKCHLKQMRDTLIALADEDEAGR